MINVCEVDDFWPVTVKHHAICRRQSNAFLRYTAYAKKMGLESGTGIFRSAL